jgi:hypothetical protein
MSYKHPADRQAHRQAARAVKRATQDETAVPQQSGPKRRNIKIKTPRDVCKVTARAVSDLLRAPKTNELAHANALRSLLEIWMKAYAETATADEIKLLKEQLAATKAK